MNELDHAVEVLERAAKVVQDAIKSATRQKKTRYTLDSELRKTRRHNDLLKEQNVLLRIELKSLRDNYSPTNSEEWEATRKKYATTGIEVGGRGKLQLKGAP